MVEMSEAFRKKLGQRIRELRSDHGWSQERLADECGLDRSYMGGIERGERNVGIDNICRIAETLGVSPATLIDVK